MTTRQVQGLDFPFLSQFIYSQWVVKPASKTMILANGRAECITLVIVSASEYLCDAYSASRRSLRAACFVACRVTALPRARRSSEDGVYLVYKNCACINPHSRNCAICSSSMRVQMIPSVLENVMNICMPSLIPQTNEKSTERIVNHILYIHIQTISYAYQTSLCHGAPQNATGYATRWLVQLM